jgi:predicted lipoprotein with Yx(FWY)xxD motif
MSSRRISVRARLTRRALIAALAVIAALALIAVTGMAAARPSALATAPNAPVRSTSGSTVRESIVVTRGRRAVYTLTGDSRRHPQCTAASGCFAEWPPVTVRTSTVTKPSTIHGRLTTWRRGGVLQLVLNGHPLYMFSGDTARNAATGEGIRDFGGTWHVARPGGARTVMSSPSVTAPPPSQGW